MEGTANLPDGRTKSLIQKLFYTFGLITVEPLALCLFIGETVIKLTNQNMYTEKACLVELKYNQSICDALINRDNTSAYTEEQEQNVKNVIATYKTYKMIFSGLVPFIMVILLGAWSDRTGRKKPLLILPFISDIVACIGYILCTFFLTELGISYLVASEVGPISICGGFQLMYIALFSYVGVISSTETRTTRIGMVSVTARISMTMGTFLPGVFQKLIGFYGVYTMCLALYIVGLFYAILVVKEVPLNDQDGVKESYRKRVGDFFNLVNFKNAFAVVFKKRSNNNRAKLIALLMASVLNYGTYIGEEEQLYQFVQSRFNMNAEGYSLYYTIFTLLNTAGTITAVVLFSKSLGCNDASLGILCTISKMLGCIIQIFSTNIFWFYIGAIVQIFAWLILVITRSMASKFCNPNEISQVNAVVGVMDALSPLIIGVFYPMLFKSWDASIFALSIAFNFPCMLMFVWLRSQTKVK